jgi:F420H(2)-dependent quinone reductase
VPLGGPLLGRAVGRFNAGVEALVASPRVGPRLGRHFTTLTYTGRRSGRTISTPVGYRRAGDVVTIAVVVADAKSWWRNFTGAGGPLTLHLDGVDRPGHAVAERTGRNRVTVTVRLDENR